MSYDQTGESGYSGSGMNTFVSNTTVQASRLRNYTTRYEKSGGPSIEGNIAGTEQHKGSLSREPSSSRSSARYNILRWTEQARKAAFRLSEANSLDDFMEARHAGHLLTDSLARIWSFRDVREEEFTEIVNILQIALKELPFETIQPAICSAVEQIIDECLLSGSVDETQVRKARELMREVGLDPFRGLTLREE